MALTRTRALPTAPPRGAGRKAGLFAAVGRSWADYLYVGPAILVMLLVIGYPLVYTVYLSFFDTPPRSDDWVWTGLGNYADVLGSDRFWKTTRNTFYWTIGSTGLAFVLGFGAALVVHRRFPGRGIVRAILLIPWVISHVATAYVFRWFLHSDYGLFGGTLLEWGLVDRRPVLLDSVDWVMPAVIMVNVWKEFPFVMIMVLAGLQTVPDQVLRAAKVDGAGTFQQFWHVTVPHLRGVIVITTLLLFVTNLNSFTLVYLLTGGGPAGASQLWITEIYNTAFRTLRYGEASAYSVILFLIMLSMGFFYVKALSSGRARRPG
jgi:multiple sugar transport system permease protein